MKNAREMKKIKKRLENDYRKSESVEIGKRQSK